MSKNSVKFLKCKFRAQMKLKFGTKKSALCFIPLEMGECALVPLGTKKKKKICKKGRDSILYTKVNIRYTLFTKYKLLFPEHVSSGSKSYRSKRRKKIF
jgi:hypothetical protein